MDPNKTKEILSVYREDLDRERLPEVAEALRALETDAQLAAWFEKERSFDRSFGATLSAITVPEGLRALIVSIYRDTTGRSSATRSQGKTKPIAFSRKAIWLSAAAVIVVLASLITFFAFPPAVRFPGETYPSVDVFRDHMAYFANSRFLLSYKTKDLNDARNWLMQHGGPAYEEVPPEIVRYRGMGCKVFPWGPCAVSLICFLNEADEIVHLFIIDRSALKDLQPATPLDEVLVLRKLETGGWMDASRVYVLVGSEPDVSIEALLKRLS